MTTICPNCEHIFDNYGRNPDNGLWFFIGKGNPHSFIKKCPLCHKDVRKKETSS